MPEKISKKKIKIKNKEDKKNIIMLNCELHLTFPTKTIEISYVVLPESIHVYILILNEREVIAK